LASGSYWKYLFWSLVTVKTAIVLLYEFGKFTLADVFLIFLLFRLTVWCAHVYVCD